LKSIEVYALNRKGLVDERRERLLLVRSKFDLIISLVELESQLEQHVDTNSRLKEEAETWLQCVKDLREREIDNLMIFTEPSQPYGLMARQFILEFLEAIQGRRIP
jgi:hypothetical protein